MGKAAQGPLAAASFGRLRAELRRPPWTRNLKCKYLASAACVDSPRAIPTLRVGGPVTLRARAAASLDPQLKRKHLASAACVDSPRAIPTLRVGPRAAGSRRLPVGKCAR